MDNFEILHKLNNIQASLVQCMEAVDNSSSYMDSSVWERIIDMVMDYVPQGYDSFILEIRMNQYTQMFTMHLTAMMDSYGSKVVNCFDGDAIDNAKMADLVHRVGEVLWPEYKKLDYEHKWKNAMISVDKNGKFAVNYSYFF